VQKETVVLDTSELVDMDLDAKEILLRRMD
jgi:hypothetical protein